MAEVTPTPAPTDAATTQTSDQSATLTPTEQAVKANPAAVQMPATTPPTAPAPTAPATPTAQASPKILPRRGLMASVLMGALKGADDAMKATGQRLSNFAANSPRGQELQKNALDRQEARQRMQIAQKKAQQESVAAMDKHTLDMLTINNSFLDNAHKAAENAHLEKLYPAQEAEAREALLGQIRAQNDADRKFLVTLEESGVHIDRSHFTQGEPFEQLTPDHAKSIATGRQWGLSNGLTGPDADIAFVSNAELSNTVLPHDVQIVTDWNMNPQTGDMTPVYSTLKAGENTALDAVIAHDAGMDRFNQKQGMYSKQLAAKSEAAKTAQAEAETAQARSVSQLNEAYVKQMGGAGGGGTPVAAIQQTIAALPASVQKDLQQYSPGIQGLLMRGAYGYIDPATFPQRLTKGGLGITRAQATSMMLEINPKKYSDDLFNNMKKLDQDFLTGKEGQAIRSFNQFLVHAAELKSVSDNLQRTNSPLLNQPLNVLKTQFAGQPGVPELIAAIEAARQEWQTFIDSGYAPKESQQENTNRMMSDASNPLMINGVLGVMGTQSVGRLDQLNETYKTGHNGDEYPNLVTPSGRTAAQALGVDVSRYTTGGVMSGGPVKPAAGGNTVPAGKFAVRVNGAIVGYADNAKGDNYHSF